MKKVLVAITLLVVSIVSANAVDYRVEKPEIWTIKNVFNDKPTDKGVNEAIKALYGDITLIDDGIKLISRELSAIVEPVSIKTDIPVKSIALFQNFNPKAVVAVFSVPEDSKVDFQISVKIANSGAYTAVAEGKDGKFYSATFTTKVGYQYSPPANEPQEPQIDVYVKSRFNRQSIRIKAKEKAGVVNVKSAIRSPDGFLTYIKATVGDKVVYDVSTSRYLEDFPMIKFKFMGKKGDKIKIECKTSEGKVFFATKEIK